MKTPEHRGTSIFESGRRITVPLQIDNSRPYGTWRYFLAGLLDVPVIGSYYWKKQSSVSRVFVFYIMKKTFRCSCTQVFENKYTSIRLIRLQLEFGERLSSYVRRTLSEIRTGRRSGQDPFEDKAIDSTSVSSIVVLERKTLRTDFDGEQK